MDIEEWEFLSDDGCLDFNEEVSERQIFLGKGNLVESKNTVFDMDYFCSSPKNKQRVFNQLVPLPIHLDPRISNPPYGDNNKLVVKEPDQDTVSQVFFKMKENEFVDMKMDSPKSSCRGIFPNSSGLKFEEKSEALEIITSPRMKIECDKEEEFTWQVEEENNTGFNIWKWSLTGVGAICSFGVAAVTICVLFFGSQQREKHQKEQKIRFQIYTDDKRIKQVVQHATKLNETISAAKGVPISRAHITIGGYYDGL